MSVTLHKAIFPSESYSSTYRLPISAVISGAPEGNVTVMLPSFPFREASERAIVGF